MSQIGDENDAIEFTNYIGRKQVGGDHYSKRKIQPFQVIDDWNLDFYEGNALKYLARHKDKNGKEDLLKAKHYIDEVIKRHYGSEALNDYLTKGAAYAREKYGVPAGTILTVTGDIVKRTCPETSHTHEPIHNSYEEGESE